MNRNNEFIILIRPPKINLSANLNLPGTLSHFLLDFQMLQECHHQILVLHHLHVNNVANNHISINEISEMLDSTIKIQQFPPKLFIH